MSHASTATATWFKRTLSTVSTNVAATDELSTAYENSTVAFEGVGACCGHETKVVTEGAAVSAGVGNSVPLTNSLGTRDGARDGDLVGKKIDGGNGIGTGACDGTLETDGKKIEGWKGGNGLSLLPGLDEGSNEPEGATDVEG